MIGRYSVAALRITVQEHYYHNGEFAVALLAGVDGRTCRFAQRFTH